MNREEFEKIGHAIAQAAQFLPALDYEAAKELNDALVEGMRGEKPGAYSQRELDRVRSFGELLLAAAKFKAIADRVADLGVAGVDFPIEAVIADDDRPAVLRAADTPPAAQGRDRELPEDD